jgi:O-antigen ligase
MKLQLTQITGSNWFFVAMLCFVAVLPLSPALVSVFSGVLLLVALVEDNWTNKRIRLESRKFLLLVPIIFLIYVLSTLITLKNDRSFYDVQKTMFYLVLPIAFSLGKEISSKQKKIIFFTFTASVFVATIFTIINWKLSPHNLNFGVHSASPVSHIRFSFQIILVFWFLSLFVKTNYHSLSRKRIVGLIGLSAYLLLFLFFQQSITGIIALCGSLVFYLIYMVFKADRKYKIPMFIGSVIILLLPVLYVVFVVHKFYDIEQVNFESIDKTTSQGNLYKHDENRVEVENGKYVYLYVCEDEMRKEWNSISKCKYDSINTNGYPIHSTLIRYLTSKGLRKDAEGVKQLTAKDISNVENGIANVIFEKKYSIYPRIYQTVWEYYTYSSTGYVNHQSFSQRIEFAKAAITIIKSNFWFGVGTGNWKTEFAKAFKANHSGLDESLYASSHNQYLNFMVKFGFVGFLIIVYLLVYPIAKTKRYNDLLFLTFFVFMFFANFSDSNLESHMGSSFFLFFYCLFLSTNGIDYLKIEKS